jgi:hypothetical protein
LTIEIVNRQSKIVNSTRRLQRDTSRRIKFPSQGLFPVCFPAPAQFRRAQESFNPTHWYEDGASRPKLTPGKFDASAEWLRGAGKGIGNHLPLQRLQANRQFGNVAPAQIGGFQSALSRFTAHYKSFKYVRSLITPTVNRLMKILSYQATALDLVSGFLQCFPHGGSCGVLTLFDTPTGQIP